MKIVKINKINRVNRVNRIGKTGLITPLHLSLLCGAALFTVGLAGCKSSGSGTPQSIVLNGAGSTFVYPVMSRWTDAYIKAHPGIQINYQSIGSCGGIQQVKSGTVDFGATDNPLTDAQLAGMKPIIQIPETGIRVTKRPQPA